MHISGCLAVCLIFQEETELTLNMKETLMRRLQRFPPWKLMLSWMIVPSKFPINGSNVHNVPASLQL